MKSKMALFLMVLLVAGCSSTKQVGDTVYQKLSFPSVFGPYQSLIVTYPVGKTNMQQVLTKDANAGPGATLAGAAIGAGGFVAGQAVRRPSKVSTSVNTSTDTSIENGGVSVDVDGNDVHVDGNGNHNGNKHDY